MAKEYGLQEAMIKRKAEKLQNKKIQKYGIGDQQRSDKEIFLKKVYLQLVNMNIFITYVLHTFFIYICLLSGKSCILHISHHYGMQINETSKY